MYLIRLNCSPITYIFNKTGGFKCIGILNLAVQLEKQSRSLLSYPDDVKTITYIGLKRFLLIRG